MYNLYFNASKNNNGAVAAWKMITDESNRSFE